MQDTFLFIENHWQLSVAVLIVLILLILIEFVRLKRGVRRLNPLQATQLINHQDATIIDIRNAEAFTAGHIVNAVSMPLVDLESKLNKLDKFKSRPLIIVGATDVDSSNAANILVKHHINALVLAGGIRAWQNAGMPLVKR